MLCPLCRTRKARRGCPALKQSICTVCCATKRITEIACPADCGYLASSREHPPVAVRRQQEQDIAVLLPTLGRLTERQHQLLFLLQAVIARHKPEGFAGLVDDDVADAAGALASTLETAARGVIYEHTPHSPPAQRLATELSAFLADLRRQGAHVPDREVAVVLRAIERGALEVRRGFGGSETAYLGLIGRLAPQLTAERPAGTAAEGRGLVLP